MTYTEFKEIISSKFPEVTPEQMENMEDELAEMFIVSAVEIHKTAGGEFKGERVGVTVAHAEGEKCERCWSYSHTVGTDAEHPTLCKRCAEILK